MSLLALDCSVLVTTSDFQVGLKSPYGKVCALNFSRVELFASICLWLASLMSF